MWRIRHRVTRAPTGPGEVWRITATCQSISSFVEFTHPSARHALKPMSRRDGNPRHIQLEKGLSFDSLKWPSLVGLGIPIGQPGRKIGLGRPYDAVVHDAVVFQPLQQHGVELCRPCDLADREPGETAEQVVTARIQKCGVLTKAGDEVFDVLGQADATVGNAREDSLRAFVFPEPRKVASRLS